MGPPVVSFCMCGFSWFILQYIRPFCKCFLCKAEKDPGDCDGCDGCDGFFPVTSCHKPSQGIRNSEFVGNVRPRRRDEHCSSVCPTRAQVGGRFVNRPYGETSVHTVGATLVVARWSDMGACRRAIRESPLRGNVRPHRRGEHCSSVCRTQAQVGGRFVNRPYGETGGREGRPFRL